MRTRINQELLSKDKLNAYFLLGQLAGLECFIDNERVEKELHQLVDMLTTFADQAYGIERKIKHTEELGYLEHNK